MQPLWSMPRKRRAFATAPEILPRMIHFAGRHDAGCPQPFESYISVRRISAKSMSLATGDPKGDPPCEPP